MKDADKKLFRDIAKQVMLIALYIVLCKLSKSYVSVIVLTVGFFAAFNKKLSVAISCWVLLTFSIILTPVFVPKTMLPSLAMRLGPFAIALSLAMTAMNMSRGKLLPLGGLLIYLFLQIISSLNGLVPQVSLMKLAQFFVFFFSIWFGVRCVSGNPTEMYKLRIFFLALIVVTVVGSVLVIPFPSIAYATSLKWELAQGADVAAEAYVALRESGGVAVFSGITDHSQTLAPLLAMMITFVLADMMFIEKRMSKIHVGLILVMMVLSYMTRSRTCLLSAVIGVGMLMTYTVKHVRIDARLKRRIVSSLYALLAVCAVGAVGLELKNGMLTRWIRKTEDASDKRSLSDAVTESRQGKIDECLAEYHQNEILGIGFQVDEKVAAMYQHTNGLILSAPIEKGLLPLMVLGEGGIVGAIAFYFFLFTFVAGCVKRRFFICLCLFVTNFMTNIGEATFFSPGATGGILWVFFAIGGYVLDQLVFHQNKLDVRKYMCGWQDQYVQAAI